MSRSTVDTPADGPSRDDAALSLVHQGWDHLQRQRPLAAWASWQRALRCVPEYPAAKEALARLETANDLPAAARLVKRFRPPDAERRQRWDARLKSRNLEHLPDAADAFAALAAEDEADPPAWYNRALCLAWMGENSEAISCLDRVTTLQAQQDFDRSTEAWVLAEILRHGAGAEALADDLRYVWVFQWSDEDTARLLERVPGLVTMPNPRDPITGEPAFPGSRIFEWLDRPMPDLGQKTPSSAEWPRLLATAVVISGVLRLSSPNAESLERIHETLDAELEERPRLIGREATPLPLSLLDAAIWTIRFPQGLDGDTQAQHSRESVEQFYENEWIRRPRHGLDGRTPLEASRAALRGDGVARAKLSAVVDVREQLGRRPRTAELYQGYPFDRLRRRLGLDLIEAGSVDPEDPTCMSEQELDRLDPATLNDFRLEEAYHSASGLGDDRRTGRFASALLERDVAGTSSAIGPTLFATLVREALRKNDAGQALRWLEHARTTHSGRERRTYDVWSIEIHARKGDPDAAVETYRELVARTGEDLQLTLEVAEELIANGYLEHADPLLDDAVDRARRAGDARALRRAARISGEQLPVSRTPDSSSP